MSALIILAVVAACIAILWIRNYAAEAPLRARRASSRDLIEDMGYVLEPSYLCNDCREASFNICRKLTRTTLAGETFTFSSSPIAGVCLRCETVASPGLMGGARVRVSDWDGSEIRRPLPEMPPYKAAPSGGSHE